MKMIIPGKIEKFNELNHTHTQKNTNPHRLEMTPIGRDAQHNKPNTSLRVLGPEEECPILFQKILLYHVS